MKYLAALVLLAWIGIIAMCARRILKYKKYISIEGYATGTHAASSLLNEAGLEVDFYISQKNVLNPFAGNCYLPDRNIIVMTREISDKASLLSFCVGCQLAVSAIEYRSGKWSKFRTTEFEGEFAIPYVFRESLVQETLESMGTDAEIDL